MIKGMTINDAAHKWVSEFNAIPQSMIEQLMRAAPDDWEELTLPHAGSRVHVFDLPDSCDTLGTDILSEAIFRAEDSRLIYNAIRFFYDPNFEQEGIAAIKQLAPKAYAPNKKKSRVFKALCQVLGVADETAGSDFQRLYAQFADELTSKKIGFKLYVSINPAHFITMSNPKGDHRGTTLTSCLCSWIYRYPLDETNLIRRFIAADTTEFPDWDKYCQIKSFLEE